MDQPSTKLIAFYLPQFHPIPENDRWWGSGFTEWTNVKKSRPMFHGHYQPRVPTDLGYYDLRDAETRAAQADMARNHGLFGFCYWHYWFAGRRLLERPFNEVLKTGEPDFPFCLAWGNQTWSGIWHGAPDRILMEQTYPGPGDHEAHFRVLEGAFGDDRYIKVDGKPLFVVQYPGQIPEVRRFIDQWRELALKAGFPGIFLVGISRSGENPQRLGFDASTFDNPRELFDKVRRTFGEQVREVVAKLSKGKGRLLLSELRARVKILLYEDVITEATPPLDPGLIQFPCAIPNWDNTPRSGVRGVVLHHSTPELYRRHLATALGQVGDRPEGQRLVFLKSWNEWAEGNYLEPDQRFGRAYLEATRDVVLSREEEDFSQAALDRVTGSRRENTD